MRPKPSCKTAIRCASFLANRAAISRFNRAIVRAPSRSVVDGLRAKDVGNPEFNRVQDEHESYVKALIAAEVEITALPALPSLPALDDFPDAVFVEDPALVFAEGCILLRSNMPSRAGEIKSLTPVLEQNFTRVLSLPEGGFVEGGDVLLTPNKVMIGLSERTDIAGAQSLVNCLQQLGYRGQIVHTPPDVLHFKTDCCLLDETSILTTRRLARSGVFAGFDCILVPDGEEAAANALRVNDVVLLGAGFPQTAELLSQNGYQLVCLPTAEIQKIDAGLSCMSLRWQSNR